mgnify:CR=1 FL=1
MCQHNHHQGGGKDALERFAESTWIHDPATAKDSATDLFMQALSFLHEWDELHLPPRDPIDLAAMNEVRTRCANWLCGEGEWKPGGGR